MKKLVVSILVLSLAFVSSSYAVKLFKIGTVDVEEVFTAYPGVDDVRKKLSDERKKFQDDIDQRKEDIAKLERQISESGGKYSEEERNRREAEIEYKKDLLADFIDDSNKRLNALKEELTKPIYMKIATVIQRVGGEKGFSLILKKAGDAVLYSDKEVDITKDVVQKLRKELLVEDRN